MSRLLVRVRVEQMFAHQGVEDDTAEEGRRNNILQKAILLYIDKVNEGIDSGVYHRMRACRTVSSQEVAIGAACAWLTKRAVL